jgi:hypothetical protein
VAVGAAIATEGGGAPVIIGHVIGELLAVACDDPKVLARLGGSIGDAARDAAAELAGLPVDQRRMWRAKMMAAFRAPIPPGIRGVHPSWIEAGLVGLPPRAREALSNGAPTDVDVWLARWACAEIPPMPAVDVNLGPPRSIEEAIRLSGETLERWLMEVGADQLAHALASQPQAIAQIARVVGDRIHVAVARIQRDPRIGALGPVRAAIARARVEGGDVLITIGARAIAPRVDEVARRRIAVRLPRPLGLAIAGELAMQATTRIDHVPTWAALSAPW